MEGWAGGVFLLLLDSDNLAVGVHGVYGVALVVEQRGWLAGAAGFLLWAILKDDGMARRCVPDGPVG